MRYSETSLKAHDGTCLFARNFLPDEDRRGERTLVVVHGTSEHGGRYEHVAQAAIERGWDVIIADLRGHGRSEGDPVHVDCFERYLHDLETLWRYFELNPGRTAVLGHSFGGLISIRFAQTRPHLLSSLVLSSPLLGLNVEIDRFTLVLGKLMSWIAPRTRFRSRVPSGYTTRNSEVLAKRDADPLIHRSVTAAWFFQMKGAIADAWEHATKLQVPTLALQAGEDKIVDPQATEPWLKQTGSNDRSFRLFAEHYHELLNEPDWPETLELALHWMDSRIPSSAAKAAGN